MMAIECRRKKLFCLKIDWVFSKMMYIRAKFNWHKFLQGGVCYEEVRMWSMWIYL